jgi:hypothetical protein
VTSRYDSNVESHDWIDVHNPTDSPIDLAGWRLTNKAGHEPSWPFPSVVLRPGEYGVVFASGYPPESAPAGELHANFRLEKEGGYLALIGPDGQVAEGFARQYAEQPQKGSYGVVEAAEEDKLVSSGAVVAYLVPTGPGDAPPAGWTAVGFDESSWAAGQTGLGFDTPGFAVWSRAAECRHDQLQEQVRGRPLQP